MPPPRGLKVERDERTDDFAEMYIDLEAGEDEPIVIIDKDDSDQKSVVRVADLLNADIAFLAAYPEALHKKLSLYQRRLQTYTFSIVLVKEAPIDIATQIFTRINVTGRPLSVFEIMVAKTFDSTRDFDLADEYDKLIDRLQQVSYETLPPATILQTVSAILVKECSKKEILKLDKGKFIDVWPEAVDAIYSAVDYFRGYYRISVSRLLPYGALLVPFSYFFFKHPQKPTGDEAKKTTGLFLESSTWRQIFVRPGVPSLAGHSKDRRDTGGETPFLRNRDRYVRQLHSPKWLVRDRPQLHQGNPVCAGA